MFAERFYGMNCGSVQSMTCGRRVAAPTMGKWWFRSCDGENGRRLTYGKARDMWEYVSYDLQVGALDYTRYD